MVYPKGTILTEMVSNENGVCIFRASVYSDEDHILATGTAYEKEGSSFINKTSYIENCETSAVGRALGLCGFGVDLAVASAEEVQNALENQKEPEQKATPKQIEMVNNLVEDKEAMLKYYKVDKIEDLTIQQASEIISKKGGSK
jgi:hypothetical protein